MKVILKADIKGTGKKGELHEVSDGYARNYLFPRALAMEANKNALNELENREAAKAHHLAEEKLEAQKNAKTIEEKVIYIKAKAGTSGRLFGAVTSKEIAEEIKTQMGIEIDKRKISTPEIKAFGEYTCEVKLSAAVSAKLTVVVGE